MALSELYDPATGKWTATGKLAESRYGHTATLLPTGQSSSWVAPDGDDNPTHQYLAHLSRTLRPGQGTWTATGSLAEGRAKHYATLLLDGTVARHPTRPVRIRRALDPASGSWSATGNIEQRPLRSHLDAAPRWDGPSPGGYGDETEASAELYDPDRRDRGSRRPHERRTHRPHSHPLPDGRVLVAGGGGDDAALTAELYDPGSGS